MMCVETIHAQYKKYVDSFDNLEVDSFLKMCTIPMTFYDFVTIGYVGSVTVRS